MLLQSYPLVVLSIFSLLSPFSLTAASSLQLSSDASKTIQINVTSTTDKVAKSSDCFPDASSSPGCNFRSAWAACQQQEASGSATTCTIALPVNGYISMNTKRYGSLVLDSNRNITVEGNNATVASSVDSSARLFYFFDGANSASTVYSALTLYGMTLQGFGNSFIDGGAVYILGDCFVSLANVTIADSVGRDGGSIYMTNNSLGLAIDGCSFEYCSGTNGGALYLDESNYGVIIQDSQFIACQVYTNGAVPTAYGGAIFLNELNVGVTVRRSVFASCTSSTAGGAVYANAHNDNLTIAEVTFTNCSGYNGGGLYLNSNNEYLLLKSVDFTRCTSDNGGGGLYNFTALDPDGGGMYIGINNDNAALNNVHFSNYFAYSRVGKSFGGGMYMYSYNNHAALNNVNFTSCASDNGGGGLYMYNNNNFTALDSVQFTNCSSDSDGGGMYMGGSNDNAALHNVHFSNCTSYDDGGGVYMDSNNNNAALINVSFTSCASGRYGGAGGGMHIGSYNSHVALYNVQFTSCASNFGGGMAINGNNNNAALHNVSFTNCTSVRDGGGIFMRSHNDDVALDKVHFISCFSGNDGGGVYMYQYNDNAAIDNVYFTSCNSDGSGGGMFVNNKNDNAALHNVHFTNCTSDKDGGGMYMRSSNINAALDNVYFTSCTSSYGGGMYMYTYNDNAALHNVYFTNCTSGDCGGGMAVGNNNFYAALDNVYFTSCTSSYGGGMYMYKYNSHAALDNVYFTSCVSGDDGGGIYMYYSNDGLMLDYVSFVECVATAGSGGAVYSYSYNYFIKISSANFTSCSSSTQSGGAIHFDQSHYYLSIDKASFSSCSSQSSGGAINLNSGTAYVAINRTEFLLCFAKRGNGGAINMGDGVSNVAVSLVSFDGCSSGLSGGSLSVTGLYSNYGFLFSYVRVSRSSADYSGGALYFGSFIDSVTVADTFIVSSSAHNGGGVYLEDSNTDITLQNLTLTSCSSVQAAGGLYLGANNAVLLLQSMFEKNNAATSGGGLYAVSGNIINIAGSSFVGNAALIGSGGGIFLKSAHANFSVTSAAEHAGFSVVQSAHPYDTSSAATTSGGYVIMNQTVSVPGAQGFVVYFGPKTDVGPGDFVALYAGEDRSAAPLFSFSGTAFPGVSLPAVRVPGPSFIVEFARSSSSSAATYSSVVEGSLSSISSYYGFTLYAYPVIPTSNSASSASASVFSGNTAFENGGAIYMSSNTSFPVLTSALFSGNRGAAGGGAVFLNASNTGAAFQRVLFRANEAAEGSGGALALSNSNAGVTLAESIFEGNAAAGSGGAVYLDLQNGLHGSALTAGNEVSFSNCSFQDNTAASGGGVAANQNNTIVLDGCSLAHNNATATSDLFSCVSTGSGGGAIALVSVNTISISDSEILFNNAADSGGGLTSLAGNVLLLNNTSVSKNTARAGGGGISLQGGSRLDMCTDTVLQGNQALRGGAIASLSSPLWSLCGGSGHVRIADNRAQFGSALFFAALSTSLSGQTLHNLSLVGNRASFGGTVFWVYANASMPLEPPGLHSSSLLWLDNAAPYGDKWATQTTSLRCTTAPQGNLSVFAYAAAISPAIVINTHDYYGQFVPSNNNSVRVVISARSCAVLNPYLSGSDAIIGLPVIEGNASFSDLEAFCSPGGNLTVTFTGTVDSQADRGISTAFEVSLDVLLAFRSCEPGQFVSGGICTECLNGSFSLETLPGDTQTCSDCSRTDGVVTCFGDQIETAPTYWRRYPTNAAVLACPATRNGCRGGFFTGDASCAEGFEGPLCSVCASGFYEDDDQCSKCGDGVSPMVAAVLAAVCIGLLLLALHMYRKYRRIKVEGAMEHGGERDGEEGDGEEEDAKNGKDGEKDVPSDILSPLFEQHELIAKLRERIASATDKIKIFVSTYQIVCQTSSTLQVTFPASFMNFMKIFSFLSFNFTSIFACSGNYNYMHFLLFSTLIPVGLSLLLLVPFAAELCYFNSISYDALKNKYLNYFFYLTYLVLPSVTTTIFQTFRCTDVDPDNEDSDASDHFLSVDMSISCGSAFYSHWVAYASVMILVYPIGIPAMYLWLLSQHRAEIMQRKDSAVSKDPPAASSCCSAAAVDVATDTKHTTEDITNTIAATTTANTTAVTVIAAAASAAAISLSIANANATATAADAKMAEAAANAAAEADDVEAAATAAVVAASAASAASSAAAAAVDAASVATALASAAKLTLAAAASSDAAFEAAIAFKATSASAAPSSPRWSIASAGSEKEVRRATLQSRESSVRNPLAASSLMLSMSSPAGDVLGQQQSGRIAGLSPCDLHKRGDAGSFSSADADNDRGNADRNVDMDMDTAASADGATGKDEATNKPRAALSPGAARLEFLFSAYEPRFWYWEVVETTRRLLLTAVISVCAPGSSEQAVYAVLLALAYIKLYSYYAPYDDDSDDVLAEVGQCQVLLTFFGALVVSSGLLSNSTIVSLCLIFGNLGVANLLLYFEGSAWLKARREAEREQAEKEKAGKGDKDAESGDGGERDEERSFRASLDLMAARLWACLFGASRTLQELAHGALERLARQRGGDGDGDPKGALRAADNDNSSSSSSKSGHRGDEESQAEPDMHVFYGRSGADAIEMVDRRGIPASPLSLDPAARPEVARSPAAAGRASLA